MTAKKKNKSASRGEINVNVDTKLIRFGFIQSVETIYFEQPSKEHPKDLVAVPATTVVTELVEQPEREVLTD